MKMVIGIVLSWVVAIALFYLIFHVATGAIIATLPAGEWTAFLAVAIYIAIGWCGGVAVPLVIGCFGTFYSVVFLKKKV